MQPDFAKAVAYYALAADAGSTEAMDALGSIYNYGGFRFAPDIAKAVAWFGAAAARNDPHGLAMTGYFYRMGTGVPRNLHLARVDLLAGAKGGDIGADEELAEMYEAGDGVPADLKTAITWYTAAADGGNPVAWFRLGKLYVDGRAGPDAAPKGIPLLRKAADFSMAEAAYELGKAYEQGHGTLIDLKQALDAYQLGCDEYSPQSCLTAGRQLIAMGDLETARKNLRRVPASSPDLSRQAGWLLAAIS
jgi:hypothetical protein